MARIPEDDLKRLKNDIAVQRLAESRGIVLKKHGQDLIGLCPFHDDHEPSLVITPSKNLWHCLGACQTGGSVIDWVMKAEGVSFRHAVELLREGLPTVITSNAKPIKQATIKKLPTQLNPDAQDQALLNQVIDYYHTELKHNPGALAYLNKRGIANNEAIDRFKIGFADRTLGYRLPEKNRKHGAAIRGRLQHLGLIRSSGHEHFRGSLVIPIIDEHGNVLEVYGRKITDNLRKGTAKHLYLPGAHQGVFNSEVFNASKEIILCESLIDALTFWCAGFRNVTCSYGIEGFTDAHLTAFKNNKVERILIAYDRDQAGDTAATTLATTLMKNGFDCYRLQFPKGMDANDYALHVQPASKSLGVVIRSALWLGNGVAPNKPTTQAITTEATALPAQKNFQKQLHDVAEKLNAIDKPIPLALDDPLPATVIPDAPKADVPAQITDDEIVLCLGDRRYRIRGLQKNLSVNQLKVNMLISRDDAIHIDTFDLYAFKPRMSFIKQAAIELGIKDDIIKRDLGKVLLTLERLQEDNIKKELQPKNQTVILNDADKTRALDLLKAPDLLDRILNDFNRCGVVGEHSNKLVGYLAAVSRKLDKPLAVMVQSSTAAGKSSLMDAVIAMMPEEDKVQYSAMTGQSLFYMEDGNLQHKILAISEEEGAARASYALKLLQSEGELTIASTGKDPQSGRLVTQEYQVTGPVMIFSTTTAIDPDEELLNRCIVLGVDEGREQTQAIHQLQRQSRTLEGLLAKKDKQSILTLHHNAQRLLKSLSIINPYSEQLTFLDDRTRLRRDHEKYLTLIDAIALLHQHQRPIKHVLHDDESLSYIEVTLDDIKVANELAHVMLGRSLDELPPQTRRLLMLIDTMVETKSKEQDMNRSDYFFSRKAVRELTGWGNTQLRVHLDRLVDMEYLLVHRGGRGQSFVYELLYDGQGKDGDNFMIGLIDVDKINTTMKTTRGKTGQLAGSKRVQNGGYAGRSRGSKNKDAPLASTVFTDYDNNLQKSTTGDKKNNTTSYDGQDAQVSRVQGSTKATHTDNPVLMAKAD